MTVSLYNEPKSVPYPARRWWRTLGHALSMACAAVALLVLGFNASVAHAESNNGTDVHVFSAQLSGAEEVPANTGSATGRAIMTIVTDTLYYRLSVADIEDIQAAHIHEAAPGANGGVVFPLFNGGSFGPGSPISGTLTLTPTQVAKLHAGEYYVNVHTTSIPAGQIRGQLTPDTVDTDFNALLLGGSADDPAAGVATFSRITTDTYTMTYDIAVSNIVSITAAHIHRGPAGTDGPIVHGLYNGSGPFDPNNPVSGTVQLSAQDVRDLLTGYLYVNVHTAAAPPGTATAPPLQIRGQMGRAHVFAADLAGAHETHAVDSIASGRAILALSADTRELTYRVLVDDIEGIQQSHIHRAPKGVNGPVIFTLFNQPGVFDPETPASGTFTLTTSQVIDLITNQYYINVHTGDYGAGEIRGQIQSLALPSHLNAPMLGDTQPAPVETDAVGLARLTLDGANNVLHHTVIVTNITDVIAAHIHLGPRGQNGPPVFTLFNPSGGATFDGANPVGGGHVLKAANLVDLLTGYYYVNVHTTAYPGGEIRGQVGGAQIYQASLAGAHEVSPVATGASGRAILALSADTASLAYRVFVNKIAGVTASHIHRGAPGENGGVVFGLFAQPGVFDAQHPISGILTLDANQALDLIAGNYYVNVHSDTSPSGEIRGQVEPYAPRAHMHAALRGEEETQDPPVDTDAVGIARLMLDDELNMVRYSVAITDIVDTFAAHIHFGPKGAPGPARFTLYDGIGAFGPGAPLAGAFAFDAAAWVDLLTGYYYINVHTTANPGGEIRGQVGGASLYESVLAGSGEVPAVDTPATGHGIMGLSADTTQLSYRVQVMDIENIAASHIHKGAVGADGPVVFTLYAGSGAFDPAHPISGTIALDTAGIFDLLQGNYYANVHTAANPGGEIRGQIGAYDPPTHLFAPLTAASELQASLVTADPSGIAQFDLDPDLSLLHFTVDVSNVVDIVASHIHLAPVGVNGPVVFPLYTGSGLFDADNPIAGLLVLDGQNLVDLLTGFYYVNVHTVQEPGGAIRGQIVPPLHIYLSSILRE